MNTFRVVRPIVGLIRHSVLSGRMLCSSVKAYDTKYFDGLVNANKVVVFMKGDPSAPRCGFSNAVVQVLRMHGVDNYDSHDVLSDQELRQGIKDYSQWPTIPQVYFNGEFVGGCDILIDMHQKGELIDELKKIGLRSALLDQAVKDSTEKSSWLQVAAHNVCL